MTIIAQKRRKHMNASLEVLIYQVWLKEPDGFIALCPILAADLADVKAYFGDNAVVCGSSVMLT